MNERALERGIARQREAVASLSARLARAGGTDVARRRQSLANQAGRLDPRLLQRPNADRARRIDDLQRRGLEAVNRLVAEKGRTLATMTKLIGAFSYDNVLKRGFAIVRDGDGEIVRSIKPIRPGDGLTLQLSDGTIVANTVSTDKSAGASAAPAAEKKSIAKKTKPKSPPAVDQGSLF